MFKSAFGFTVANFLLIILVILNNVGPGWEVPVETLSMVQLVAFLLLFMMLFSLIAVVFRFRQFKSCSLLFKIPFCISAALCILSAAYILARGGLIGQLWFSGFPFIPFTVFTVLFNMALFAAMTAGLFSKRRGARHKG